MFWSAVTCHRFGRLADLSAKQRGAEAARLTFPATADGYRALHRHLFQDLYDWAGQDRTVNIAKGGSSFAHVPYIARELDKRFADTRAGDALKGLARDEFFDRLGNHINEINAIHPFREGNGRTMRHHAAQLLGAVSPGPASGG